MLNIHPSSPNRNGASGAGPPHCSFWLGIILALGILPFLTSGCIDTISFEVERDGGKLVVDGMITDGPGPHEVVLRRTSNMQKISDPVSGALITLTDHNQEKSLWLSEVEAGIYQTPYGQLQGVPGRSYSIKITLPEGQTYRSRPETMPGILVEDQLNYQFDTITSINEYGSKIETEVLRILRDSQVPDTTTPYFIKWKLEETYKFSQYDFPDPFNMPAPYCYVTAYPAPKTIKLLDGSKTEAGTLPPEAMAEREIDYTFYQRHFMNLVQYSISRSAHEYWQQVDQIVNQAGTIFDVPPANPNSNLFNVDDPSEDVFGYFHAARTDTSRFYLLPSDLPIHIRNPCSRPSGPNCQRGCSNFDNSTQDPPWYWLEKE